MSDAHDKYREQQVAGDVKAIEDLDKTLVALSAGAIGTSMAFLKDVVGSDVIEGKWSLVVAWCCWCVALTSTLCSFYVSHLAHRNAIRYFDRESSVSPGRHWTTRVVRLLNPISLVCFLAGLVLMGFFVTWNF